MGVSLGCRRRDRRPSVRSEQPHHLVSLAHGDLFRWWWLGAHTPHRSAAICISLGLSCLAAGAATVGFAP